MHVEALLPAPPPTQPAEELFLEPLIEYSGWWRRVGAVVIDSMILGVSATFFSVVLGASGSGAVLVIGFLLMFGGTVAYFVLSHSAGGATVGKSVLGIKVIMDGGGAVSLGVAALRVWAWPLSSFAWLFGLLWPLWDPKNQTFHDKIALTVVVKT